jgi:uncharacterized linocin/CFP29 family protein
MPLAVDSLNWPERRWEKLVKKAKKSDAIMTGILVTRFKMGLIDVEDLKEMSKDMSWSERASAAKKVLVAVEDST